MKKNNIFNYPRCAARLYNTPWLIEGNQLQALHNIFQNHVKGNIPLSFMGDDDEPSTDNNNPYDVVGNTAIVQSMV